MTTWLRKLVSRVLGGRLEDDLDDEVRIHLELATADYERRGLGPAEARRAARREFGGINAPRQAMFDLPLVTR